MNRNQNRLQRLERQTQPANARAYIAILSRDDYRDYQEGRFTPPPDARVILPAKELQP